MVKTEFQSMPRGRVNRFWFDTTQHWNLSAADGDVIVRETRAKTRAKTCKDRRCHVSILPKKCSQTLRLWRSFWKETLFPGSACVDLPLVLVTIAPPCLLASSSFVVLLFGFHYNVAWVQAPLVVAEGVHLVLPGGKQTQYRRVTMPQADREALQRILVDLALVANVKLPIRFASVDHPTPFTCVVRVVHVEEVGLPDEIFETCP